MLNKPVAREANILIIASCLPKALEKNTVTTPFISRDSLKIFLVARNME